MKKIKSTATNKSIEQRVMSKVHSRIRMISNGGNTVNMLRSLINGSVAVDDYLSVKPGIREAVKEEDDENIAQTPTISFTDIATKEKKGLIKGDIEDDPPTHVRANIYLELRPGMSFPQLVSDQKIDSRAINHFCINDQYANLVKVNIPISEIPKIAAHPAVIQLEGSQSLQLPMETRFPFSKVAQPKKRGLTGNVNQGKDVIIGIIDVGGFDFSHPDFLNREGETRFKAIWDQGSNTRMHPENHYGASYYSLDYGSIIDKSHMNDAIKNGPKEGIPIHTLEPQSQQIPGAHATHVASIAAGNFGVCSKADLVGVLISVPRTDEDRLTTFSDSSRISDAVDFLIRYATEQDMPISINISLGTNGHAHDGTSAANRWIDAHLYQGGRAMCVAGGNAGQERGSTSNDFGYVNGRIHASGVIPKNGLTVDLEWQVLGNGQVDMSENELEIWYEPQDRFAVMLKPPGMDWIGPIRPQKVIENMQLQDMTFVSIYNKLFHRANGNNQIGIYLSPNLNENNIIGVQSGLWKVRIIGEEIRDGRFDAWIERDEFSRSSDQGWNFPSFFSENSNVDNKSINSLACGFNVISVGNYDQEAEKIHLTSSQGPSRDLRLKPEIIAPGTDIIAANGFAGNRHLWIKKTGSSMASPYVCGIAGLMLELDRDLTSSQIAAILKRTSKPLSGFDYNWKNDMGFGLVNLKEAMREVESFFNREDITDTITS